MCIYLYIVVFITVFFHLCYEGAIDLDTIRDINDRHGLEVQIMEFGQIPKQVFTLPHPKRLTSAPNLSYSETLLNTSPESTSGIVSYIFFFLRYSYRYACVWTYCILLNFLFSRQCMCKRTIN